MSRYPPAGAHNALGFKQMVTTRAMCPPGSQSDRLASDLGRTSRWRLQDGALLLELTDNSGTMRFRRAATP